MKKESIKFISTCSLLIMTAFLSLFVTGCQNLFETKDSTKTYTVTYNKNSADSGSVPSDQKSYEAGSSISVLGNTGNLTRNGYTFGGWSLSTTDTHITYQQGDEFYMGTKNIVLYAVWVVNGSQSYTVVYDKNNADTGDVPVDSNMYTANSQVTILGNTGDLKRDGYTFKGWSTSQDGSSIIYVEGNSFTIGASNVTLFAVWISNTSQETYNVTYDKNNATDGNIPVDSHVYVTGWKVTVLGNTGNLIREGYTFEGWSISESGSDTIYTEGQTFIIGTANVVLYAVWSSSVSQNTYTVLYNQNGADAGSVPTDETTYKEGDLVTIQGNTGNLIKDGYTFSGWSLSSNGENPIYTEGFKFFIKAENVILYAVWVKIDNTDFITITGVSGGSYRQENLDGDGFIHNISDFSMDKYEVTYELWYEVKTWAEQHSYYFESDGKEGNDGTTGAPPTQDGKLEPVTSINWHDCLVWCNAYSEKEDYTPCYNYDGKTVKDSRRTNWNGAVCDWTANGYRLPTEGEWQYAASCGGLYPVTYASGADNVYNYTASTAGDDVKSTGDVCWESSNSDNTTHKVGQKSPNKWGLYDMSGNVWELCWDNYDSDYSSASSTQTDYHGAAAGSFTTERGGSYYDADIAQQIGSRARLWRTDRESYMGFRLVRGSQTIPTINYNDIMISVTGVSDGSYQQENLDGDVFIHNISDFSIAKYEVTYELWYEVKTWAEQNGYYFESDGKEGNDGTTGASPTQDGKLEPVTSVNWHDCLVWCNAYSEKEDCTPCYSYDGKTVKDSRRSYWNGAVCDWTANGYRLPTEGEWQYAASCGGLYPITYASGADNVYNYTASTAGDDVKSTGDVCWESSNSDSSTHKVGQKSPNKWGLYDMSGNVWELCWDNYESDYSSASSTQTDYHGAAAGSFTTERGGSYYDADIAQQIGSRARLWRTDRESYMGFRLAQYK